MIDNRCNHQRREFHEACTPQVTSNEANSVYWEKDRNIKHSIGPISRSWLGQLPTKKLASVSWWWRKLPEYGCRIKFYNRQKQFFNLLPHILICLHFPKSKSWRRRSTGKFIMWNPVGALFSGVGHVVGSIFGAPLDFLSGKSCK